MDIWEEYFTKNFIECITNHYDLLENYALHNGITALEYLIKDIATYIGVHTTLAEYLVSYGGLVLHITIDAAGTPTIKPTDSQHFLQYINARSYMDIFLDYCDAVATGYGKKQRASYRKKIKYICRRAKTDCRLRQKLEQCIESITFVGRRNDKLYNDECKKIFRQHYIYGDSIAKIISNHSSAIYESEIHRRLDYVIDIILDTLDGGFPSLADYYSEHKTDFEKYKQYYLEHI